MKILMVHNAYRQAGGEEVAFFNEARLLERRGHCVIRFERNNADLADSSVLDRFLISSRLLWSLETRREFAAELDRELPDLVHVHNTFMAISPSIYSACSERGIPVVQTLHNFRLLCPSANLSRNGKVCEECVDHSLLRSIQHGCFRGSRPATTAVALMLALHRALETWSTSVTRFIALTEFAKQKFIAAGFPPAKLATKPNFIDQDPGQRRGGGDYALFIGRLAEDKGLPVLLNAWQHLSEQYPLQIVGDGADLAKLQMQANQSGLAGIAFQGRLPHQRTIEIIKRARFLVVPSTWYEAFPMCIVEAFACGVPVVCSKIGSLAEIVEDGHTGLHFNSGDHKDLARVVNWAWHNPSEVQRMGRNARAEYERDYTPEENYCRLLEIYEQALARPDSKDFPEPVALRLGGKSDPAVAAPEARRSL